MPRRSIPEKRRPDGGAADIVVTQGTDSIEETSSVLDLLVDREPVVVTGAMRNPTLPSADGPANRLSVVRVATSEAAWGRQELWALSGLWAGSGASAGGSPASLSRAASASE